MCFQVTRTEDASRVHYYCTPLPRLSKQVTRISHTSQRDQTLGRISLCKNTVARDDNMPPPPPLARGMGFLWRPASSWRKLSMKYCAWVIAAWKSSRSFAVRHAPTQFTNPSVRRGCGIPRGLYRNRSIPCACVARLNRTNLLPPRGSCLASERETCGPL